MAHCLQESGFLDGLVLEHREAFLPKAPEALKPETACLFEKHFRERQQAEEAFFGAYNVLPDVDTYSVTKDTLNDSGVQGFIKKHAPDLLISYGVHKLTSETVQLAKEAWNIHGGLSPWYRGCITHFWPSYMLEPQMTGMTIHTLTQDIDGGQIIHQVAAPLVRGDGLHELACRAVFSMGEEIKKLLCIYAKKQFKAYKSQGTTGRIWRSIDWRPEHLHIIYDLYGNRIVDHVLDQGKGVTPPALIRQF